MRSSFFLFFLILGLFSCKTTDNQPGVADKKNILELPGGERVVFLDKQAAGDLVTQDNAEQFFERVRPLEMSIQMKRNYLPNTPREQIVEDYRAFLREDMTEFAESEVKILKNVFQRAHDLIDRINPDIFPKQIRVAKTSARHYGPSVYYTREEGIVIPYNELEPGDENALLEVMLHEIFHIYSRYHPKERNELYELVGFKPIGVPVERLKMDSVLSSRILFNPDGIDFAYQIMLERDGESFPAVPIIVSTEPEYTDRKPAFFGYLQFALYELRPFRGGMQLNEIVSNPDGSSRLNLTNHPEFFGQIKDNTQYIIHPDEIMADNFKILVLSKANAAMLDRLSEPGKQLIEAVEDVIDGK